MVMSENYEEEARAAFVSLEPRKAVSVALTGAGVGVVVWLLALLLGNYVLNPILCHGSQAMKCVPASQYGEMFASVIGAGAGLFFLVRLQVFRPLLVVLAAIVSLWGLVSIADLMPWYGVLLSCAALYMLSYLAFTWLARLRSFGLVAVLFVVLIVAVRYTLSL